ncbi:hypothetical protein C5167_047740 [Papaver somniferum]|uniref:Uncharacterized protein n=1 Tax=Papaver somniferum TaxID=3469 RepID=A0A4Y7LJT1_PAPSO|nr:hypothetical protein C5167_047740 [Papaver somniferum]
MKSITCLRIFITKQPNTGKLPNLIEMAGLSWSVLCFCLEIPDFSSGATRNLMIRANATFA